MENYDKCPYHITTKEKITCLESDVRILAGRIMCLERENTASDEQIKYLNQAIQEMKELIADIRKAFQESKKLIIGVFIGPIIVTLIINFLYNR
jgi:predicted  nucleic acid-binding Zn-ribbon protein